MTLERTHMNHLTAQVVDSFQDYASPVFITKLGRLTRPPQSPLQEAQRAAQLIYQHNPKMDLSLCLSGGVDSEAMAQAFILAKIPFKVFIFRFKDELNQHDISWAIEFCQKYHLKYTFLDIDALHFFESGKFWQKASLYQCNSPQLCLHIHLLDQVSGCPILAWNLPNIDFKSSAQGVGLPQYKYWSVDRYFEKNHRLGIPFFFLYTPELFASFLRLPLMRQLMGQHQSLNYDLKCELYRQGGFQIQNRPNKYTGFENIRSFYDRISGEVDYFNILYRRPLEANIFAPKSEISLIHEEFFTSEG